MRYQEKIWDQVISKLATVVDDDPKAPFTIATTVREGDTPFSWLLHFTFDPYFIIFTQPLRSGRIWD